VHETRHETLEQLALTEDDRRLVARAPREVAAAFGGRGDTQQPREEQRPPGEQRAAQRDRGGEGDRGERYRASLALRIAALIAGTTACRSPITA
jgi:hypothetical protein